MSSPSSVSVPIKRLGPALVIMVSIVALGGWVGPCLAGATNPGGAPAWFDIRALVERSSPRLENGEPVWEYELVVTEQTLYLADGTPYKVWAFGGTVPGPTLVAREGERIRITLINETSNSHTIHSHGLYVPHRMDGVPHVVAHTAADEMLAIYEQATGGRDHRHRAGESSPSSSDADQRQRNGKSIVDRSPDPSAPSAGHAHGSASAPGMAGGHSSHLPSWAHAVAPGEVFTYEFIAKPAGTHFYHCHMNTNEHLDRGMSGPLIVLPKEADPLVDVDVAVILDEWNSDDAQEGVPGDPRKMWAYNYFTLNGRSFPHTEPLKLGLGQVARVRLIHAGAQQHFMHLHGLHFLVIDRDGRPLAEPLVLDTVEIGPGQRVDLLVLGENPGAWPFHCHATAHVTNSGIYPGGMLTKILVGDEMMPEGLEGVSGEGLMALRERWKERAAAELAPQGGD